MKMLHKFECHILADGSISHAEVQEAMNECATAACGDGEYATVEYVGCREMTDQGAKVHLKRKHGISVASKTPRKIAKFVKPVA